MIETNRKIIAPNPNGGYDISYFNDEHDTMRLGTIPCLFSFLSQIRTKLCDKGILARKIKYHNSFYLFGGLVFMMSCSEVQTPRSDIIKPSSNEVPAKEACPALIRSICSEGSEKFRYKAIYMTETIDENGEISVGPPPPVKCNDAPVPEDRVQEDANDNTVAVGSSRRPCDEEEEKNKRGSEITQSQYDFLEKTCFGRLNIERKEIQDCKESDVVFGFNN